MLIPQKFKLKNTIKFPTTLIVGGLNKLGIETANTLMEQGGYVIIVDVITPEVIDELNIFPEDALISYLDITSLPHLEEDIRRLDYVFYFSHGAIDFRSEISTQDFLVYTNYLDSVLALATKFGARFQLTTSAKAHQVLNSENPLISKFGQDTERHFAYTEMELQKYSEGLTLEYHQKVNLNCRICRLGEIIGDGIDFYKITAFNNLLLRAVSSERLEIKNDGLENEWFVHVNDCSYGLIKSQFSKDTNGNIYTISYDTTFTHLSLAYKIQELEENSKEIFFSSDNNGFLPIQIKKPAPNLSQIGWLPRVPFDKAVEQSLAFAKIFLTEYNVKNSKLIETKSSGITSKLKNFINFTGDESIVKIKDNSDKADINQIRKKRVKLAREQIILKKKRSRTRTLQKKLNDLWWIAYTKFTDIFKYFKKKSPFESAFILLSFLFLTIFYFTVFSPLIVISVNLYEVKSLNLSVKENFDKFNFEKAYSESKKLNDNLSEISEILGNYEFVFAFLNLSNTYANIISNVNSKILFSEGISDISYSQIPLADFLKSYQNNTQLRSGTDSYISITDVNQNFDSHFSKIKERSAFLTSGKQKVSDAKLLTKTIAYPSSLSLLKLIFLDIDKEIAEKDFKNLELLENFTYTLGTSEKTSNLFVILDNTRLKPLGGDLAAFSYTEFDKGKLTGITTQTFNDANFNLTKLDALSIENINKNRFSKISSANVNILDLSSIYDFNEFSDAINILIEDKFGRKADNVFILNLEALSNYINLLDEPIQINSIDISADNFLNSLNQTQNSNASLDQKYKSIAEIFANFQKQYLENLKKEKFFSEYISINLENLLNSHQNITSSSSLNKYVTSNNYNKSLSSNTDSFVNIFYNIMDDKYFNLNKYPTVKATLKTNIQSNFTAKNSLNINIPDSGTFQEIGICLPLETSTDSIKVEGINQTSFTKNFSENQKCILVLSTNESELLISWSIPSLASETSKETNLNFLFSKINGAITNLDFSFNIDGVFKITSSKNLPNFLNNTITFNKNIFYDEVMNITLSK